MGKLGENWWDADRLGELSEGGAATLDKSGTAQAAVWLLLRLSPHLGTLLIHSVCSATAYGQLDRARELGIEKKTPKGAGSCLPP